MKRQLLLIAALVPLLAFSQLRFGRQQRFHRQMPPGNYSGIAALGNDRYAVVSDKAPHDGFYVFHISIDTLKGRIRAVTNEGYRTNGQPNRDMEGIAYAEPLGLLFISGEDDNKVNSYGLDGKDGPLSLPEPVARGEAARNYGLESLTYDPATQWLWTTTERPVRGDSLLRLCSYDLMMRPCRQYAYQMDEPQYRPGRGAIHAHGVSELCALGDGRLLVLEREVHVPRRKLGARVAVKLYETRPDSLERLDKRLLGQFTTKMTLLGRRFANYEGMCVAHRYHDGRLLLLMVADSQNRYGGVARDWLRTVVVSPDGTPRPGAR